MKYHVHFTTRGGTGLVEDLISLSVHPADGCWSGWGIDEPGHVRTVTARTARAAVQKALGVSRYRAERMLPAYRDADPPVIAPEGPVITPEEFSRRMAALKLRYEVGDLDRVTAHLKADELLCQVLVGLGYGDGVEIYDAIHKRY